MILTVTDTGATLRTDRAQGAIIAPIEMHRDGSFSGGGTFAKYRGGPDRADLTASPPTARFDGRIDGDTMSLSIHVADEKAHRHFTLKRGARIKLIRCL